MSKVKPQRTIHSLVWWLVVCDDGAKPLAAVVAPVAAEQQPELRPLDVCGVGGAGGGEGLTGQSSLLRRRAGTGMRESGSGLASWQWRRTT